MRGIPCHAAVLCGLLAICLVCPAEAATSLSAQEKKLYARCKAKYGRMPVSVEINTNTVICYYKGMDKSMSEEQARAHCVKQYGPSVSPSVRKVGGEWVCYVRW